MSSIVTKDGIHAFIKASETGKKLQPKYFIFSDKDIKIDPNVSAKDFHGWKKQDINQYQKINDETLEFICDVKPDEAKHYTKSVGLFLEDGTLFMIAKPPYPFPPSLRQTIKIQLKYQNANNLMSLDYISWSEEEQSLAALDTALALGFETMESAEDYGLKDKKFLEVCSDVVSLKDNAKRNNAAISSLEENVHNAHLGVIENSLSLGIEILENSEEIGLIKQKIGGK